jgi:hypothetical protein
VPLRCQYQKKKKTSLETESHCVRKTAKQTKHAGRISEEKTKKHGVFAWRFAKSSIGVRECFAAAAIPNKIGYFCCCLRVRRYYLAAY